MPTTKCFDQSSWPARSAFGAITSWGTFYQHTHAGAIRAPHVVTFLTHLLRQAPGEVIVVLARAMIHRAKIVQELVARTSRLMLENLPTYAPELNPIEHVWTSGKRKELGNFCAQNVAELKSGLRRA
ncbi:transposase (plasmid) [Deinococcus sp. KNUC1210]|uniref:transposase n=1 Tax=Deinococcus sp. KNUC1210 TaxID=2917691 RepID=UPI001EF130AC|nr:transposase [Deinococcus sp. KNUC1210]ULH18257.1 transposase [Deinococcus sp. KNUC1210]